MSDLQVRRESVIDSLNQFALDVYRQLAAKGDGNLFFSPASIHAVLSMTLVGAKEETRAELARVLHLEKTRPEEILQEYEQFLRKLNTPKKDFDEDIVDQEIVTREVDAYTLNLVNALWSQKSYPFGEEYLAAVRKHFGAELRELDFATRAEECRKTINDWVGTHTEDRIPELIPPGLIDEITRLVLTNAVYFKSSWVHDFEKHLTRKKPFTLTDGKRLAVDQMYQQDSFGYAEDSSLQLLDLPYRSHQLGMVVLLPRAKDGLRDLESQLSHQNLKKWLGARRSQDVQVTLPKWKVEGNALLSETLKEMGARKAFEWPGANLLGMSPTGELFISELVHQAFVEVDEKGTEAAAATAAIMAAGCAQGEMEPPKPKVFTADHPYVFLIRHTVTRAILFMGRVNRPESA